MSFLGIGAGKIELKLPKNQFASGEKIDGTAILTINEDIKANGVVVEIWGERIDTTRDMNGQIQTKKIVVYKFANNLDNERVYAKSESPKTYSFSFDAPQVGGPQQGSGGIAGRLFSSFGHNTNTTSGPIMWFIEVKLIMPAFEFSIKNSQQISIAGGGSSQMGAPAVMQ